MFMKKKVKKYEYIQECEINIFSTFYTDQK